MSSDIYTGILLSLPELDISVVCLVIIEYKGLGIMREGNHKSSLSIFCPDLYVTVPKWP
jgi:hypothetical protein